MFRLTEEYPDLVLTRTRSAAGRPVLADVLSTISGHVALDDAAPLFAGLRADMGLPADDDRSWTVRGRHVRLPEGLPVPTAVAHPTTELLERVLAGLGHWTPVPVAPAG
jgi:hypothetical protein